MDDWLREHHASFATPLDLIRVAVLRTTGEEGVSFERIVQGHANEVYRVLTHCDSELIVRINQHGSVDFHEEAWAMERCRTVGVPVPWVYGVETLTTEPPRDIMVLACAAGRPLHEVEAGLTPEQRRRVWRNVGAVLGAMHSIHVEGFDQRVAGCWKFPDWQMMIQAALRERRADVPDMVAAGLTSAEADTMLDAVGFLATLDIAQPVLCHGDLGMDHIFVDDSLQVTALIDFGLFQGGSPALDFGVLHMYHPDVSLSWLMDGYGNTSTFEPSFEAQLIAQAINVGASFLAYDQRAGNSAVVHDTLLALRAALMAWNTH